MLLLQGYGIISGRCKEALDGKWQFQDFGASAGPSSGDPGLIVTMTLDAGDVSGSTGVNSYQGTYTWKANGFFEFDELAVTERGGPPAAMIFERRFLDAIEDVRSYELVDMKLRLGDGDGGELLIFAPVT
ncbi:META domain-containing protein [Corynebacterium comes]|uniref:META domain-containing protein n=1 Tax=Corynebacterium comes TaxID=2675218 RepID=UPI0018CEE5BD|nr:META domain-containing protein [Corynebacterium comes]